MNILESIRKRTGLLVGLVGFALLIFILESLLSSGGSIFGEDYTTVAVINGKKIDSREFFDKVNRQLDMVRQARQSTTVDEETRIQVLEYIMNNYISENTIQKEFEKLGLEVSEDELYDMMVSHPHSLVLQRLTDKSTGKIYEQLATPDGALDPVKFRAFLSSAMGDQELFVKQMEEDLSGFRKAEKYSQLIKKGIYVTSKEALAYQDEQNTAVTARYVMKKYTDVSDTLVHFTDADLKKYYKENLYKYQSEEDIRKIEYVAFNIAPSDEDIKKAEENAARIAAEFKTKPLAEDSAFIAAESENNLVQISNFTRDNMIIRDTSVFTSPEGTVFGPYNEGAYLKIYKLQKVLQIADSARVRHILVGLKDPATQQPKRTPAQAKKSADSIATLLKEKKAKFDSLVLYYSDDPGSKTNGGDYGWFNENTGFVEPFKMAGLMGKKGELKVVQTQFGYHIIEVLDVSEKKHTSYRIAQISKLIEPSEETRNQIYREAQEFAGKNNTAELFDKACEEKKLSKRLADNIKRNDRSLAGIPQAKDMVKWAFSAKKGEVNFFAMDDRVVVVKLAAVKDKGSIPFDEIKEDITEEVIRLKKAEWMLSQFKQNSNKTLDQLAEIMRTPVEDVTDLNITSHFVPGLGHDDIFLGVLSATPEGKSTPAVASDNGVFVANVIKRTIRNEKQPVQMVRNQFEQTFSYRAEGEYFNALKKKANIQNYLYKFE
jgi:peptidyl-prolyl cis-trans isomerase D